MYKRGSQFDTEIFTVVEQNRNSIIISFKSDDFDNVMFYYAHMWFKRCEKYSSVFEEPEQHSSLERHSEVFEDAF